MEELAPHHGLESCANLPQGGREALAEADAGWVLSHEIFALGSPTWFPIWEGNMAMGDRARVHGRVPGGRRPHARIEASQAETGRAREHPVTMTTRQDRPEKARKHNAGMHAPEQSDCVIVPQNGQNKFAQANADGREGRTQAKENPKEATGSVHRDQTPRSTKSGGCAEPVHWLRVRIQGRSRMR